MGIAQLMCTIYCESHPTRSKI